MIQKPGLLSPLHVWRRLRLGQKIIITLVAACFPLVALGLQVSNTADRLLREQLQNNLGLTANIEAARMEQALALTESSINALARDEQLVAAAKDSNSVVNEGTVSTRIRAVSEEAFQRLSDSGLVGVSIYEFGELAPTGNKGMVSQMSLDARDTYIAGEEWEPEAFLADGVPHLTIIRQVGSSSPLTIVSEWSVPAMLAHQDFSTELGFSVHSMLLQLDSNGEFLILNADDPRGSPPARPLVFRRRLSETRVWVRPPAPAMGRPSFRLRRDRWRQWLGLAYRGRPKLGLRVHRHCQGCDHHRLPRCWLCCARRGGVRLP
ncbi:MAG: hypothetical protein R2706_12075 [Acidimicrobiales bacterium]